MPTTKTIYDLLLIIGLRYIIIAGLFFLVWYVIRKKQLAYKKIQRKFPTLKDYQREILFSVLTIAIFSVVIYVLLNTPIRQYTWLYTQTNQYSNLWFYSAFILMLLLHDTYFYFTHRLMHHPKLFKFVHLIHHKSTNPSPWAAFAFHPLEALVEVGVVVLFVFTMPLCRYHLFFFFLFMMVYNVYGHLGWELYPKNFQKTKIGQYINTSINHNQHHQFFKGNYGLYFLWWDKWLGTLRKDYATQYQEVKNRKQE